MKRLSLNSSWRLLTVAFFAMTASLAIAQVETDYLAILLQGKKIGYAAQTRTTQGDKVVTTDNMSMTLGRGG